MAKTKAEEKRKYLRTQIVFPLRLRFMGVGGKSFSEWIGGFTHDLSREGICVLSDLIKDGFWQKIVPGQSRLELYLSRPFSAQKVYARGVVVWKDKGERLEREARFYLGVKFEAEFLPLIQKILRRVKIKRFLSLMGPVIVVASLALGGVIWQQNQKLIKIHKKYIQQLLAASKEAAWQQRRLNENQEALRLLQRKLAQKSTQLDLIKKRLEFWQKEYRKALAREENLSQNASALSEVEKEKKAADKKIKELKALLGKLNFENQNLRLNLKKLAGKKKDLETESTKAVLKLSQAEQVSIDDMYNWIKVHQNRRTGLIASFEGDANLSDWAFTYDQALAAIIFTISGDYKAAERILGFYLNRAASYRGGYLNAYYASQGEICEYIAHAGPNIWIGLASLNFVKASGNKRYLLIAEKVAKFIESLEDTEGGIRGGVGIKWYSTEHNLDAYAFFWDFYQLTHKQKYRKTAERILSWLKAYAYSRQSLPVKRGKGDSTIATDTYAWSITAVGPQVLFKLGMDADAILEFARENCGVKTYFQRPEGKKVEIEGFDFAKAKNLARGGVVSAEWTSQMILAFEIMAYFYHQRHDLKNSQHYFKLARFYFDQLKKLIVSSPSPVGLGRGVLVYASQANADTGHGWRTPRGNRTGSIAATAYYILSYYGYNPLNFQVKALALKNYYDRRDHKTVAEINSH